MKITHNKPLFAWDCLEDYPELRTIRDFLQAVPDAKLLDALRSWRGHGRNDCPVVTAWGVLLLTIALRHPHVEATLGELRRNRDLGRLIGIRELSCVPKAWSISRFLRVLGQEPHLSLLREVFDQIIQALGEVVLDLGEDTAGDSAWLSARNTRSKQRDQKKAERGLPQPTAGRKEYKDESGKVVKVYEWFGYKFHILVDRRHEVALAYTITSTKKGDNQMLPELVRQAQGNLPAGRIQSLAYDKGRGPGRTPSRPRADANQLDRGGANGTATTRRHARQLCGSRRHWSAASTTQLKPPVPPAPVFHRLGDPPSVAPRSRIVALIARPVTTQPPRREC